MIHAEITEKILGCSFEIMNELGSGFLESVYEKSLALLLKNEGLMVEEQKPLDVYFRGESVGRFFADLVVEKW